MKVIIPSILLLLIVAVSQGQNATGPGPVSVKIDAPASAETNTQIVMDANDGDAGKECAADDCAEENVSSEESESTTTETSEEEDANCPSRSHVIRCAAKYLDTNQNGILEREELDDVMKKVPWLLRGEILVFAPMIFLLTIWMYSMLLFVCEGCELLLWFRPSMTHYFASG